MQVQGSGKIRLREGGLVRLAYAQQNGHPFRPRVTRGDNDFALTAIQDHGLIAGRSTGAACEPPDAAATNVAAPGTTGPPPILPQPTGASGPGTTAGRQK